MSRPIDLALPHIAKLHAYTPGLQPTEAGWTKLNTNECPYPPSPRVAEAIRRELGDDGALLRLYPNPRSEGLRQVVAKMHNVGEGNVCIGNGSDDILNLLVRVFAGRNGTSYTFPSYSLYPVLVAIHHGHVEVIDLDRSMHLPLEKITSSSSDVFFLTSPNAPTGVGFRQAQIEEVLKQYKGMLVVDEAYAAFAEENVISLLARYENLVVVRTLSKAYALAGIRIGYALASLTTIELLDRVRDSYNVSRLSQVAAIAALGDTDYYSAIISKIKSTRDHYSDDWRSRFGWFVYPSETNFIFVEPRNGAGTAGPEIAKSAYEFFSSRKVLIRYFPSHALTASFLRISVGNDDEMLVVNQTFEAWRKNG